MKTSSLVCADANLLAKLALPEGDSDAALNLWRSWKEWRVVVGAPTLIVYEFVSITRQQIRRSLITLDQADAAMDDLLSLPLSLVGTIDLHKTAFRVATELEIASAYDAHYVALATLFDCEF